MIGADFPHFALILAHHSRYLPSGPMIGNLAESSDKAETMELIAHPKRTLRDSR